MKFLLKEENNLGLRDAALRIWRLIGDVPGKFVRARRFDIRFSPGLSFSNYGKRGVDTNGGDPCGELARLTKSSQAGVCAEQGLLHCIFGILMVTDNGKPTSWTLPDLPRDRKTDRDFAIVSRVFHPDTHAMLVELAGITSYGTDAAGDLVTNPDLIAEALRGAPEGWQRKNLQLVLSIKVIGGTPTTPKVVASWFW